MNLEEVYQFLLIPPPTFIGRELAVCYVLSVLLHGESYGTELIERLEREYPQYRLSDTVLYNALKFLESEKAIASHWEKVLGRGRPRRMYRLNSPWLMQAKKLADFWWEYVKSNQSVRAKNTEGQLKILEINPAGLKQG